MTVLGQVAACAPDGDRLVPVAGRGADLLVALVLWDGAATSAERLIDEVWPEGPPASGRAALQTLVSRLRSAHGADLVRSTPTGYALGVGGDAVDLLRAERTAAVARAALHDADHDHAAELTAAALSDLNVATSGVRDPALREQIGLRADRLRTDLLRTRVAALLAGTDPGSAVPDAEDLTGIAPLDDTAQLALMRALQAAGRSTEALASFAVYRERLAEQLGTDPAPAVTEFHLSLLTAETAPTRPRVLGVRTVPGELVGRSGDVVAVREALHGSAVVTVVGIGGLGKTRLVQEVARGAAEQGQAVAVIELASVRDPADLLPALGDGLRVPEPVRTAANPVPDPRGIQQRVRERLSEHPTLVVLDNCEQVLDAVADWVADATATVPGLRVLATSRAPLGVPGERVHPLLPLPATTPDGEPGPAMVLFAERARAVRPDVALPPDVLARLCARLDGLPLAIELAAARTRSLTVEEVERRLSDRFSLLTGGGAGLPERHRTLHAVIEWSWDLLTADQRVLARRVATLPDGFAADVALALAGPDADEVAVLDDLDALVAQSLLRAEEHRPTRTMRYRMLELVREFGEREARSAGDTALVRTAIGDWARDLAVSRIGTDGPDRVQLDPVLEREQDNLVALLRGELAQDDARPDVLVAVLGVSAMRWLVQGAHDELAQVQRQVLARTRGWTPPPELADAAVLGYAIAAAIEVMWGDLREGALARVLVRRALDAGPVSPVHRMLATLVRHVGDPVALDRVLAEARISPDQATRRFSLLGSWTIAENAGRIDEAIGYADGAYRLGVTEDDPWTIALAAVQIAGAHTQSGRADLAVAWIERTEQSLDRLRAMQAGPAISAIEEGLWQVRAMTLLALGEFDAAAQLFDRMADQSQDPRETEMLTQLGAAETAFGRGDIDLALTHYRDLVRITIGDDWRQNPWRLVATGACLAAHALAGSADRPELADLVESVRNLPIQAAGRGVPYADRPVLGTVLLGMAAWRLATVQDEHTVLPLMALAEQMHSRQDYRPLHRHLHWERAVARYGEQAVRAARDAEHDAGRSGELDRAVALLRG